jgi:hypothetical protein
MKKILPFVLVLTIVWSCNENELQTKNEQTEELIFDVKNKIKSFKERSIPNSTTEIDPSNPNNPFDYYGEAYSAVLENFDADSYNDQHSDLTSEEIENLYISDVNTYLNAQGFSGNIEINANDVNSVLADDLSSEILNSFESGFITETERLIVLTLYEELSLLGDAYTANEVAKIFENAIASASFLTDDEYQRVLSLISVIKYDNASPLESSSENLRRGCGNRALGAAIIGFFLGVPLTSIAAASMTYLACEAF